MTNLFKGCLLGLFITIMGVAFSNVAQAGPLFGKYIKTPSQLREDVKFWEAVFKDYSANQCIIHDSRHLDVVYVVTNLPRSRRASQRKIKKKLGEVRRLLVRLGKGKKATQRWEKRILARVPKKHRSASFFKRSSRRLRCQRGVSEQFAGSLNRSSKYMKMIKKVFKKHGIPTDLVFLPHLESGFNNRAVSRVGAKGLWQIMPSTARGKLRVSRSRHRDERFDPYKATEFAAKKLKQNYRKTKSWPLAITAYNYGINGVMRAVKKYGTRDYMVIHRKHRTRIFKFAARNFFPSFLAVRNLGRRQHLTENQSSSFKMARKAD